MKTSKQGNDITITNITIITIIIIMITIKIINTIHRAPTVLKASIPHTHPMRSELVLTPLYRGGA